MVSIEWYEKSLPLNLERDKVMLFRVRECNDRDALLRGVASLLAEQALLVELVGHRFTTDEVASLLTPLRRGGLLIVLTAVPDGLVDLRRPAFASRFADVWLQVAESSASTTIRVSPEIGFNGEDIQSPGRLVVIHVASPGSGQPKKAQTAWLDPELVEQLQERGRSMPGRVKILRLGDRWVAPVAKPTMPDLCMLHARDGKELPRRHTGAILEENDAPLSWTDVQQLLVGSASGPDVWRMLNATGRLSAQQLDYMLGAKEFLREHNRAYRPGVELQAFPSIYDVVWLLESLSNQDMILRGQREARDPLDSTLLRRGKDGLPITIDMLVERMAMTEAFIARLRQESSVLFGRILDDEELLAVAQHFGFPTPLLDFTRSVRVAAFFATLGVPSLSHATGEAPAIGVIFRLSASRANGGSDPGTSIGINLLNHVGVRFGNLRLIDPHLPDSDDRITRQQGVFVAGYQTWQLQERVIDRYYFIQEPGVEFEDETAGITKARLLPTRTEITAIADDVRNSFAKRGAVPRSPWSDIRLSEPDIMGTQGRLMEVQIEDSEAFLKDLKRVCDAELEPVHANGLYGILDRHFAEARVEAMAGTAPKGVNTHGQDVAEVTLFNATLDLLASWSGLDAIELWSSIAPLLEGPPSRSRMGKAPKLRHPVSVETPSKRVALACSIFLAAWEHLRYVDGIRARDLMDDALLSLRGQIFSPRATGQ